MKIASRCIDEFDTCDGKEPYFVPPPEETEEQDDGAVPYIPSIPSRDPNEDPDPRPQKKGNFFTDHLTLYMCSSPSCSASSRSKGGSEFDFKNGESPPDQDLAAE